MDQALSFLGLGWVGSLLGLVGLALSIWFYQLAKREALPTTQKSTTELVGSSFRKLPESVTILYNEKPVPRVMKTVVQFWNHGNATLRGDDIASADPLRLCVENGEILTATITNATRPPINPAAIINPANHSEVLLNFEFLDGQDGFTVECIHTGDAYSEKVYGTFKGVPKGIQGQHPDIGRAYWATSRASFFLVVTSSLVAIASVTTQLDAPLEYALNALPWRISLDVAKGVVLATTTVYYLKTHWRRHRSKPIYPEVLHHADSY